MSAPSTVLPLPLCLPANVSSQGRAHPVFPSSPSPERPTGPASKSFLCKLQGIHEASAATVVIRQRKAIATSLADASMRSERFYFPRTKQTTRVSQSKLTQNVGKGEVRGEAAGSVVHFSRNGMRRLAYCIVSPLFTTAAGVGGFGAANDATLAATATRRGCVATVPFSRHTCYSRRKRYTGAQYRNSRRYVQ